MSNRKISYEGGIRRDLPKLLGEIAIISDSIQELSVHFDHLNKILIKNNKYINSKIVGTRSSKEGLFNGTQFTYILEERVQKDVLGKGIKKEDYESGVKEIKRLLEIKKNLIRLEELLNQGQYATALQLVITIRGQLEKKFEVLNHNKINKIKAQLNSLTSEMYKNK